MPVVSPAIYVFHRLACFSGVVWLLKSFSALASRTKHTSKNSQRASIITSREQHFEAVLLDTHEEKILSPVQTGMMWRLRSISRMGIKSVMTPIAKLEMLDVKSSKADLLKKLQKCRHSRYPVYDGWRTNIIGFVNIYDSLAGEKDFSSLHGLVNTIYKMDAGTSVLEAINTMQCKNEKIILVMRSSEVKTAKPLGIVTMKDLAEELLGELGEW
jgi:CBS domain containing-hemolysin-like protein